MTTQITSTDTHQHVFLGDGHSRNERKVWLVIALTATMMVVEIAAGSVYGSMALIADGWHMSTHAAAMLISALAYLYARRHIHDRSFTFGTGKFGDLAGFASAVVLALIALLIGWESFQRLTNPIPISFGQAIAVAVVGLAVNLVSAWLLKDDHDHHHGHHHDHDHHDGPAQDNNLRAAYLHVLADALTSVLAIAALLVGSAYGWLWADPVMGIIGGMVIARWSWGLIRDTGSVLLDRLPDPETLPAEIREIIERDGDVITDLHVWQVGPGHYAAILAIVSPRPATPEDYRLRLRPVHELSHVTVEVSQMQTAAA
ncbi:CDF family Co(II)/Ni(II) efflux transporter DmeF [Phreatobacter sp. AB_2022a]|uniref:CDF family Co(II)/Ni(II) efflux transporter DmeF n=1 Tax=Phreatobacter sp. AB_2022a TaxID=3003134 RepID=UPI002286E30E|nr:CDF family Co(II)/Ni(II) efflux transporter DmeF [Phreatobacter sp. AB_2022a]MCZ0738651.1 CDF family Co(II)/Ni(II) efflux transporter DmeF [Phreatobacter sp. AB_2022a]